jgi:hypothetical protein
MPMAGDICPCLRTGSTAARPPQSSARRGDHGVDGRPNGTSATTSWWRGLILRRPAHARLPSVILSPGRKRQSSSAVAIRDDIVL